MSVRSRRRAAPRILLALLFSLPAVLLTSQPASAYAALKGSGSSWAAPAITQFATDINVSKQITVNYNPDGSAAGRNDFIEDQADFASSDIAFLTSGDPFGGQAENPAVAYSYVPIVAGGTAFMYNLHIGTRRIENLRLSGLTLAKIFTGQISDWSDPQITHDYGTQLPRQHITVVTRSDGSGASYMFSQWLEKQYPSQWNTFCTQKHGPSPCPPTEFYPNPPGGVQRSGSDQVANYIASNSLGAGSIGYDEYAYALSDKIPVVRVLNAAGYYTMPDQFAVAIGLQKATINTDTSSPDFLIQQLDGVYTNPDPRSYPLSSYNYLIVPRTSRVIRGNTYGPPKSFNTGKGQTLTTWLNYVLCGGQKSAGKLGYSPLPKNLVQGGFLQTDNVPGSATAPTDADAQRQTDDPSCANPTYAGGSNALLANAPNPPACDRAGVPACTASTVIAPGASGNTGTAVAGAGAGSASGQVAAGGTGSGTGRAGGTPKGAAAAAAAAAAGGAATGSAAAGTVDPVTGQVDGAAAGTTTAAYAGVVQVPRQTTQDVLFGVLTAVELIAAVAIPTWLGIRYQRRRSGAS